MMERTQNIKQIKSKALTLLNNHEFDKAVTLYKEVLAINNSDSDANFVMAINDITSLISSPYFQDLVSTIQTILKSNIPIPSSFQDILNQQKQSTNNQLINTIAPNSIEESVQYHTLYTNFSKFIHDSLIPKIKSAQNHIKQIKENDNTFEFNLTKQMSGLEENLTIEEYELNTILLASLEIEALTKILFAYNWDISDTEVLTEVEETLKNTFNQFKANNPTQDLSQDSYVEQLLFKTFRDLNPNFGKLEKPEYLLEGRLALLHSLDLILELESNSKSKVKLTSQEKTILTKTIDSLNGKDTKFPLFKVIKSEINPKTNDITNIEQTQIEIMINLHKFFTNPIENIFDQFKVSELIKNPKNKQLKESSDFPDEFDFTINGIFPELTTMEKWNALILKTQKKNSQETGIELENSMEESQETTPKSLIQTVSNINTIIPNWNSQTNQLDYLNHINVFIGINKNEQNYEKIEKITFTYPTLSGENKTIDLEKLNDQAFTVVPSNPDKNISSDIYNEKIKNGNKPIDFTSLDIWYLNSFQFNKTGSLITENLINDYSSGQATITVFDPYNTIIETRTLELIELNPNLTTIDWEFPKFDYYNREYISLNNNSTVRPTLKWKEPQLSLPNGYSIAYKLTLELSVDRLDYSKPAEIIGDWEENSDKSFISIQAMNSYKKYKFIWNSLDDNTLIYSNEFQLPVDLEKTERNTTQNYHTMYHATITPMIIKDSTLEIMWEGIPNITEFFVGDPPNPWTVQFKGTITFPEDKTSLPMQEHTGSWKVGLFKETYEDNGSWKRLFDFDKKAVEPMKTSQNASILVDLGTTETIYNSQNNTVNYEFSVINQTDDLFSNWESYKIAVWYDLTSTPSNDNNWSGYGDDAQTNKVDVYNYHTLEYFEMFDAELYYEQDMLNYNNWKNGENKKLTDEGTVLTIDHTILNLSYH